MSVDIWAGYLGLVVLMMITPGPSHLLMLSNAAPNGAPRAMATAAGDLSANVLQMLAAGLGLAALVAAAPSTLAVVKWAGVAYLVWVGIRKIRAAGKGGAGNGVRVPLKLLFLQGFLTSATNPKAVVFFAALFPLFISAEAAFWPQWLILAATYVAVDGAFLLAYGLGGDWLAARLRGPARPWLDRAGGVLMIVAAVLLGLKSPDQSLN